MDRGLVKLFVPCFVVVLSITEISTQSFACENGEWACNNGDCIALNTLCNGFNDCRDGSDETMESCSKNTCSQYSFRCNYGACVDSAAKCDGINDCRDNSDESPEMCANSVDGSTNNGNILGDTFTIANAQPLIILFNGNGTANKNRRTNSKSKKRCRLDVPLNIITKYKNRPGELESGQQLPHATSIIYKCRAQHSLRGAKGNLCIDGTWYNEHPTCIKYCSTIAITGTTITAKCEVDGVERACNETLPGTIARISCSTGYKKPDEEFPEILTCGENGQWDHRPVPCDQVCGTIEDDITTYYQAPWHTSIYQQSRTEPICTGSVINARIVLSAAHCFWDFKSNEPLDISQFNVAIGKRTFYNFRKSEKETPQLFKLVEIFIPPNFKDSYWYYNYDLAVLVLDKYINFVPHIKPVCLDWEINSREPLVPTRATGQISGWQIGSDDLEIGDLTIASYEECAAVADAIYNYAYTGEKFCAAKNNETCLLWGGGGFVTESQGVYYLRGIISHSINFGDLCSKVPYVAISNTQFFSSIITEYETRFRPRL